MWLTEVFRRSARDRLALTEMRANKPLLTNFDISWEAMRGAIREARDDLAAGKLRHVHQADETKGLGPCFNMGVHRVEAGDHSIVGLVGLVERKLGLQVTGMIDLMRHAPDNSLWDLFYPSLSPAAIEDITPRQAASASDRWIAKSSNVWESLPPLARQIESSVYRGESGIE